MFNAHYQFVQFGLFTFNKTNNYIKIQLQFIQNFHCSLTLISLIRKIQLKHMYIIIDYFVHCIYKTIKSMESADSVLAENFNKIIYKMILWLFTMEFTALRSPFS